MCQVRSQGLLIVVASALATVLALTASGAPATADPGAGGGVIIDVTGARRSLYPIAVPVAVDSDGAAAREAAEVASFDLGVAGVFKVVDPSAYLADLSAEKLGVDVEKWKATGAFGVIKSKVTVTGGDVNLEFRLYEVSKGAAAVLTRVYAGKRAELRRFVHTWCNEVLRYYTGQSGFFGSKIAFVAKGRARSTIQAMDFDGHGVYRVSNNSSTNLLPAWSRSGGQIAYTSYMRGNPDLYVGPAGGGRPKRISQHRGMNTGAAFSPDGSKIALTLSKDGNPEIYVISASDGKILQRITNDRGIDTSPAWSPDGSQLAFVSDRQGGPQIFVVSSSGGTPTRVSTNGSYNTTPTWSPKPGTRVLAYTTRDGGRYDIVTLDLATKAMTRVTQGDGNNEEPSFSPDGRVVAFAKTGGSGSGVWLANADGTGTATRVWSGAASGVEWGPTP
ncbi:MAG: Tol-Pal system beta propeller repeat protein TolB [Kofleriaceae bacterium]